MEIFTYLSKIQIGTEYAIFINSFQLFMSKKLSSRDHGLHTVDWLGVRILHYCGPSNPGLNPGLGKFCILFDLKTVMKSKQCHMDFGFWEEIQSKSLLLYIHTIVIFPISHTQMFIPESKRVFSILHRWPIF